MTIIKNTQLIKGLNSYYLIAVFPVLALYEFISLIDLGYFSLSIFIVFSMLKDKKVEINLKIIITMMLLILINLITGVIKYVDVSSTINNSIGMFIFTFFAALLCITTKLNREKLYQACKVVGIICTAFLYYQFLLITFTETTITGNLMFLKVLNEAYFQSLRPTSFFSEPAHYVIYVAPVYAASLIKKEYFLSSLFFIGLLLSGSSTGVLIGVAILGSQVLKGNDKGKKIIFLLFGIISLIGVTNYFYANLFDKFSIESLSNNIRVFGSIEYFKFLSPSEWLFGIGINRLSDFLLLNNFGVAYNYANAIFFSFLSFGIVGGVIWISYYLILYNKISSDYKTLYFILIFISFSDQILFNRNLLYLLIWVYAFSKIDYKKWKKIYDCHLKEK